MFPLPDFTHLEVSFVLSSGFNLGTSLAMTVIDIEMPSMTKAGIH